MQSQRVNRTDPESVKIVVLNTDGSGSMTTGMGVCLVPAGASIDGISAVRSTGATMQGFVGVAAKDIAINAYGLVVCSGYAASVFISNVGSSITITRGDILKPGAVAGTFFSSILAEALSTQYFRYVITGNTLAAISGPSWVSGIVRAAL